MLEYTVYYRVKWNHLHIITCHSNTVMIRYDDILLPLWSWWCKNIYGGLFKLERVKDIESDSVIFPTGNERLHVAWYQMIAFMRCWWRWLYHIWTSYWKYLGDNAWYTIEVVFQLNILSLWTTTLKQPGHYSCHITKFIIVCYTLSDMRRYPPPPPPPPLLSQRHLVNGCARELYQLRETGKILLITGYSKHIKNVCRM